MGGGWYKELNSNLPETPLGGGGDYSIKMPGVLIGNVDKNP